MKRLAVLLRKCFCLIGLYRTGIIVLLVV